MGGPRDGDIVVGPHDDDVVVWLDADDWLYDDTALQHLAATYRAREQACLMTYGSLVYFPYGLVSTSPPFPPDVVRNAKYRRFEWISTHLRSAKYRLWKRLPDEALRNEDGEYLEMTVDMASMFGTNGFGV